MRRLLALCLLMLPALARADGEIWSISEGRLPIFGYPSHVRRMSARAIGEFRFAGRAGGLYQGLLRIGPTIDVLPWLVLALNGVAAGERSPSGDLLREYRFEIEPMVYGRAGILAWQYRNRFEFRFRDGVPLQRFRLQLRLNFGREGRRFIPFLWEEAFFGLSGESFSQNRLAAGIGIRVRDGMRIDLAYVLRLAQVPAGWRDDHCLALTVFVGPATRGVARPLSTGLPPAM